MGHYKLEWAERQGNCQVAYAPVRFILVSLPYDDECTAHSFILSPNFSETPETKIKSTQNGKGESVTEKTYVEKGKLNQIVKK